MEFVMEPIGVIHTPFTNRASTPIQPARSQALGQVEVFPKFAPALQGLEAFSHITLLWIFHQAEEYNLLVIPYLDDTLRGLFATRYPARPNPIGLSTVRLRKVENHILEIEGVDMLEGTPLLDIKPYVPEFDIPAQPVTTGWYANRSKK